ncbi:uncharacterized protein [Palaemon carinicauda]|uniref:uncharacterized protein n=1 Tax=Palaemon carinicauda TaxID=392227 RepID=UPI0035B5DB00
MTVDYSEYLYIDEWTAAFRRPLLESDILGYLKPYHHWVVILYYWNCLLSKLVQSVGMEKDHTVINKEKRWTLRDVRSYRGADIGSDHQLLIGTVKLKLKALNKTVDIMPGFDTTKLLEDDHKETFPIEFVVGNIALHDARRCGFIRGTAGIQLSLTGGKVSSDLEYIEVCPFENDSETNQRLTPKNSALISSGFWTLASILAQSSPRTASGGSVRVLSCIWLLMSFILATIYRSNLKAMLILPKVTLPFDNLEELTASGLPVWVAGGSVLHDAAKTGRCDTYAISENFLRTTITCLLMQKGSPWKAKLDPIIIQLRESGILDHIYKRGVINSTECLKPATSLGISHLRPMDLGDFYGVFMVYAGGVLAAAVSFAVEVASARRTTASFKMSSLGGFREIIGIQLPKRKT